MEETDTDRFICHLIRYRYTHDFMVSIWTNNAKRAEPKGSSPYRGLKVPVVGHLEVCLVVADALLFGCLF